MKLRLTQRALGDLGRIERYLRARNPGGAHRVGSAIQAGLQLLASYPGSGGERSGGIRRLALPRYPYLIFYRIDASAAQIEVLTIRHAAREPED